MLKTQPIDEEAIMSGLQELENLRQEFDNQARVLTGGEEEMPWEMGPPQFKTLEMPSEIRKMMPVKQPTSSTETAPAPAPTPAEATPVPAQ